MKILAVQLKRIGDLILTTPALQALREAYPDAEITLLVEDAVLELLPAIRGVDQTRIFRRKGRNGEFWRGMIFSHYDVCLDFTGTDRSALLAVLSKAPRRIAFNHQKTGVRQIFYTSFVDSPVRQSHTAEHYLHLLRPLGVTAGNTAPVLDLPDWAPKKAQQILDARQITPPYIVVQPGSARPEKYWVPERWAKVIDFCQTELKTPCVLTGSGEPMESEHAGEICRAMRTKCENLVGKLDLLSLAAVIQKCGLLLSVDSAAMHIGAAFEVPQVALFGRTNPYHWRPRHDKALILHGGGRQPLTEFAPKVESAEVSEISTEAVIDAITTRFFST